jgi:glycogen(starch) synthase
MSLPAAAMLKMATGKPMVAHIHSTEYDRIPDGNGSPFITKSEYEGMRFADRVVAVSAYTKQLLVNKYNIPAHKIDVVHNGMDLSRDVDPGPHHFATTRPVVVFMGRLTGQKGADYFLNLAQQTLKDFPQALFVVAGSGDMYHQLLWQTAYQGLSASVLFAGFVRGKQKEMLLDRADVFVMPSLSEPFGLVALEAAQRHTPVIASKNSGVKEVLPSAIQVDFWDVNLMKKTIIDLLKNQTQSQNIVQNQLQELKDVTWQKAAINLKQVYRKAFTAK